MEVNVNYGHVHRDWNSHREGHPSADRIAGHEIHCYGHFLVDFLLNLIYAVPPGTRDVRINLLSIIPADYGIATSPLMKQLREIYPSASIEIGRNDELSPDLNFEFLRSCELTREMYKERLHALDRYVDSLLDDKRYPRVIMLRRGHGSGSTNLHDKYIKNIDELDHLLRLHFGDEYQMVSPEEMPFIEQIRHYRSSKILVSMGGSCAVNALFMNSGSTLITARYSCHTSRILWDNRELRVLTYLSYDKALSPSCGGLVVDCDRLERDLIRERVASTVGLSRTHCPNPILPDPRVGNGSITVYSIFGGGLLHSCYNINGTLCEIERFPHHSFRLIVSKWGGAFGKIFPDFFDIILPSNVISVEFIDRLVPYKSFSESFDSGKMTPNSCHFVYRGRVTKSYCRAKSWVRERIGELTRDIPLDSTVAVHVRNTDYKNDPQVKLREASQLLESAALQRVYLATDDIETVDLFRDRFGTRMIHRARLERIGTRLNFHLFQGRITQREKLLDCLIDLYVLTKAKCTIYSENSSWGVDIGQQAIKAFFE
jgi:hypothetical protein